MYFGIQAALVFGMLLLIMIASWLKLKGAEELFYIGGIIAINTYILWSSVGMWRCSPLKRGVPMSVFIWPLLVKIIIIGEIPNAASSIFEVLTHPCCSLAR